ncbi:MAG: hypothetical protein HYW85_02980 [Deltaproteobacteria bacterium]|nr:hypothetical protein [Deltaproteobacteria bacterium]MBI3017282.1 hypothetical protein [Deltaproteobacteria bacterium]
MGNLSVLKDLEILQELQKLDLEIDQLQYNKNTYPKHIEHLNETLEAEKKKSEIKRQTLLDLEKKKKSLDLDLADKEGKIKKSEEKMMAVKSNEEYQAMKREIEGSKQDNGLIEEQILEVMLQIDDVKSSLNQFEAETAKNAQAVLQEIQKVKADLSHIDEALNEKNKLRQVKVQDLSLDTLAVYQRIRTKESLAVSELMGGKCIGCSMTLPPQLYNQVHKGDAIHFCPNCLRILIYSIKK